MNIFPTRFSTEIKFKPSHSISTSIFFIMSFELWGLFWPKWPYQVSQSRSSTCLPENKQPSSVLSKSQTRDHSIFIQYSIPQHWDKNPRKFRVLLKRGQCHLSPYMHDFSAISEYFVCACVSLFLWRSLLFVCVCLFVLFLRKGKLGQVSYPLLFCVSTIQWKFGLTHHTTDHHHISEDKQQNLELFTDLCFP